MSGETYVLCHSIHTFKSYTLLTSVMWFVESTCFWRKEAQKGYSNPTMWSESGNELLLWNNLEVSSFFLRCFGICLYKCWTRISNPFNFILLHLLAGKEFLCPVHVSSYTFMHILHTSEVIFVSCICIPLCHWRYSIHSDISRLFTLKRCFGSSQQTHYDTNTN